METTVDRVWREFSDAAIDAMLIGGFALAAFGVARQTLDVDFLVSEEQGESVAETLGGMGYAERERTEAFVRSIWPGEYSGAAEGVSMNDVFHLPGGAGLRDLSARPLELGDYDRWVEGEYRRMVVGGRLSAGVRDGPGRRPAVQRFCLKDGSGRP